MFVQRNSTATCVLVKGTSAAYPPQPPTQALQPAHSFIHGIGYIIVAMKKLLKIEQYKIVIAI